jgi:hypothetical protein
VNAGALKLPRFRGHPFTWESPHAETTPSPVSA